MKNICDRRVLCVISCKLQIQMKFSGISGKSQILFAIVYTTRYLDLVTTFVSTYNTVMKFVFILTSYATVYLMYVKFKATYDRNHDTFRIEFLLIPCVVLALLFNHEFTVLEVSTVQLNIIIFNESIKWKFLSLAVQDY